MPVSNESDIKQLINTVFKQQRLQTKITEVRLREVYEKVMGQTINARTTEIKLYGSKLSIALSSSPLKAEMNFNKEKIIALLNTEMGAEIIDEIWIK